MAIFLSDVYQVFIMFPKITFKGTSEDWNYNYFVLPPELYESILPCCFDLQHAFEGWPHSLSGPQTA